MRLVVIVAFMFMVFSENAAMADDAKWKGDALVILLSSDLPSGLVQRETAYRLGTLSPSKKVPGGYFITADPLFWPKGGSGASPTPFGNAFFETSQDLAESSHLTGWVVYVGDHSYTASNGFRRSVPSFRLYSGKKDPELLPVHP